VRGGGFPASAAAPPTAAVASWDRWERATVPTGRCVCDVTTCGAGEACKRISGPRSRRLLVQRRQCLQVPARLAASRPLVVVTSRPIPRVAGRAVESALAVSSARPANASAGPTSNATRAPRGPARPVSASVAGPRAPRGSGASPTAPADKSSLRSCPLKTEDSHDSLAREENLVALSEDRMETSFGAAGDRSIYRSFSTWMDIRTNVGLVDHLVTGHGRAAHEEPGVRAGRGSSICSSCRSMSGPPSPTRWRARCGPRASTRRLRYVAGERDGSASRSPRCSIALGRRWATVLH